MLVRNIKSYEAEFQELAGSFTACGAFAPAEEEDDGVDLVGSDEEEDAEAERVEAYNAKKPKKPETIG